ncbi:MAG: tetraacyldisaccharide 4'-kinase [Candidatus Pelagibacter sp. TMED153]|nr:MAG: tetraacyldisaccharide 4'-kinase [Candidatus Pelagibacter sp. TMED153]
MKFFKPKFWESKNNIYSILLRPISIIVQIVISLKKILIISKKFNIPIICVGNVYLGGTGKTPISIEIAKELEIKRKKPVIIKKYYKNQFDEHLLINQKFNSLILNNNRVQAIKEAEKKGFDVVVLDDGFQDHSFKKNLNIICFHSNQSIGNGLVLPSGPLRENLTSLKKAHIVVINGNKNHLLEKQILNISSNIEIYYSKYTPLNIQEFQNKKLFAFAGVGNPNNFFDLLKENNLNVQKTLSFPDHYHFNKLELEKINEEGLKNNFEIITTEKDFYRIKNYGFDNIKYLKIELQIHKKDKLIKQILNYL